MTDSIRIWHVDTDASSRAVDGIAAYVRTVAREQSAMGHAVTLFSTRDVDAERRLELAGEGIRLVVAPRGAKGIRPMPVVEELRRERPDIVQFHGAWIPRFATVAAVLRRVHIPYVYTPHGGLASVVRSTRPTLRKMYTAVMERPLIEGAAGVAPVVASELPEVHDVAPRFGGLERVVMPPVPHLRPLSERPSRGERPRAVFLGRFEIFQKGIDDLVELARFAPGVDIDLYGAALAEHETSVDQLRRTAPSNVTFRDPVFGDEKVRVLCDADVYVQLSRFEGFPVSIGEAMMLGVPCAVSERIGLAATLVSSGAGAVLSTEPRVAGVELAALLADRAALATYGAVGRAFAEEYLRPESAATALVGLYTDVLAGHRSSAMVALPHAG